MNPRFEGYPGTNDQKWFAVRKGFDLPEAYWQDFMEEYKPMWDFWQKDFHAFDPNPQPIWGENGAPGYRADFNQPEPSVGVRVHSGAPRGMILVCPGGGWFWKACYEGTVVAEHFYNEGFNVAVLDYRVNPYPSTAANEDAARAMRYLRANAERLNTLPDQIAMMGFSAGSFLTGYCASAHSECDPNAADPIDRVSCRPNAAILCYGAGSSLPVSRGLLGYDREAQQHLSRTAIERNITADCPPFFIWQCAGMDDPRNATQLADVLAACGVPFELHIFPYGNHGTALSNEMHPDERANDPHIAHWTKLCCEWLRMYHF